MSTESFVALCPHVGELLASHFVTKHVHATSIASRFKAGDFAPASSRRGSNLSFPQKDHGPTAPAIVDGPIDDASRGKS
jgi:hypothetical protein